MKSFSIFFLYYFLNFSSAEKKKNVIVIMADDLALNDISLRGSNEIPTPNIDALALNGIVLNRFYTPPLCTPSRCSYMTGKYPHNLGMQELVILSDEPFGLSTKEKVMPQYFKEAGYSTHLIGKWHLGFYQQKYTPTRRGYDTFFGYLGPYIDYFSYTLEAFDRNFSRGYDMRRNLEVARNLSGEYVTNLFTSEAVKVIKNHDKQKPLYLQLNHLSPHAGNEDDPMQALKVDIERFSYIKDLKRRTLAAMIYQLDLSVGEVVKTLKDEEMLKDSIVVFFSDNGGPTVGKHSTASSNYPLRGQKQSGWEGGIRTNAFVYAPFLPKGVVRNEIFYIADFLPTLRTLSNAGFAISDRIDGIDQSRVLKSFFPLPQHFHPRKEVIFIDDVYHYSSLILDGLKLVNGSLNDGIYDGWLGVNKNCENDFRDYETKVKNSTVWRSIKTPKTSFSLQKVKFFSKVQCRFDTKINPCILQNGPCLFDILNDPCEQNDLSMKLPAVFNDFKKRLNFIEKNVVQSRRKISDPQCDPKNFNFTWNWWQKDDE